LQERRTETLERVDAWSGLGERLVGTVSKGRQMVLVGWLAFNTFSKEAKWCKGLSSQASSKSQLLPARGHMPAPKSKMQLLQPGRSSQTGEQTRPAKVHKFQCQDQGERKLHFCISCGS
jgi:hypothetical protein